MSLTEDLLPYLLFITCIILHLARSEFGTIAPIDAFSEQDRLESSITKDDSGSEEAVHNGYRDLD